MALLNIDIPPDLALDSEAARPLVGAVRMKRSDDVTTAQQHVIMFPNSLLEEVEDITVNEDIFDIYRRRTTKSRPWLGIEFPIFGRDMATIRSPSFVSSINAIASSMTPPHSQTQDVKLVGNWPPYGNSTTFTTAAPELFPHFPPSSFRYSTAEGEYEIEGSSKTMTTYFDWEMVSQQLANPKTSSLLLAVFLLIFPIITVFGNLLVVLSVCIEKSLRSTTNYYIASLAFADILVGALVMPLAVYVELAEGIWGMGNLICDIWIACDVTACTASILHLVAISIDRLLAVTRPVSYARSNNYARVWFSIGAAWLVSSLIGSPIILGANNIHGRQDFLCTFYNADFILASSLGSFYIPSFAIVAPYFIIFRTLQRRAKKMHRLRYCGGEKAIHRPSSPTESSFASIRMPAQKQSVKTPFASPFKFFKNQSNSSPSPSEQKKALESPSVNPPSDLTLNKKGKPDFGGVYLGPETDEISPIEEEKVSAGYTLSNPPAITITGGNSSKEGLLNSKADESSSAGDNTASHKQRLFKGHLSKAANFARITVRLVTPERFSSTTTDSALPLNRGKSIEVVKTRSSASVTKAAMRRSTMTKERRATIMTVTVLALFFGCWIPFFSANTAQALCIRFYDGRRCVPGTVMATFAWLGYINSLMNPIVYAVFNSEFRKTFKKLLRLDKTR